MSGGRRLLQHPGGILTRQPGAIPAQIRGRFAMLRVYLTICELPDFDQPAAVARRGDRVLVAWDSRCLRVDITSHLLDILDRDEQEALAAGLGFGFPLPDWTVADRPAFLFVPEALRLHGAPAFQGGGELIRRADAGQVALELAAYHAERDGMAVDLQAVDDLAYA